jgi:hypothetical protein
MHTDTTFHVTKTTGVRSYILDVPGLGPTMYLKVEGEGNDLVFIARDTDFFDKLANEAERLVREFVGDVPVADEPLHMTGQYCEREECVPVEAGA